MNFENQKQAVKRVVDQLSTKFKNTTMVLNKGAYSKYILKGIIPGVVIGALSIGTIAIAIENIDKQKKDINLEKTPSSTSQSLSNASINSVVESVITSSSEQIKVGATIPPILPENMPGHYIIAIESDIETTPLNRHYILSNLEKPDEFTCIYGYDKEINQHVFYITNSYYKTAKTVDILSGRDVIAADITVLEEFGLREAIMSDQIEFVDNFRRRVSNGNINTDQWEDKFNSKGFYKFADILSAKYGNGPVYKNYEVFGKETSAVKEELPIIGSYTRKTTDIQGHFTVVEPHLWDISPEFHPDVLTVKIMDGEEVLCETEYNYNNRTPETEATLVFGYDDSLEGCTVTVVPTDNLKEDNAEDYLSGNIVNNNLLLETLVLPLDALALPAYANSMINQGLAKGENVPTVELNNLSVSADKKMMEVTFTRDDIIEYAEYIRELFSMPELHITEKNPVKIK